MPIATKKSQRLALGLALQQLVRNGFLLRVKGRSWPPLRMLLLIFAISGEQLPLNVAGDSAQTLSVLEDMGGVLDD